MIKSYKHVPKYPLPELQILWFQPSTQKMPGLWKEVHGWQQDQPLQGSLQKQEKKNHPQPGTGT